MLNAILRHDQYKGLLFTFLSVMLISFSPILHKISLNHVKPLCASTIWCFFSAFFSLLSVKLFELKISKTDLRQLFKMSITSSLGMLCLFIGLSTLDPSTFAFINRSYILFIFLLGIFILKEPTTKLQKYLLAANLLGLAFFSYQGFDFLRYKAILYTMLSAFLFAYSNMQAKIILKKIPAMVVNFYSHFFSFLILSIIFLLLSPTAFQLKFEMFYIILSAFIAGFLGLYFLYQGIACYSFTLSGVIRSFSPLLTTLYALPLFGFDISPLNLIGILLIFLSSLCLMMR